MTTFLQRLVTHASGQSSDGRWTAPFDAGSLLGRGSHSVALPGEQDGSPLSSLTPGTTELHGSVEHNPDTVPPPQSQEAIPSRDRPSPIIGPEHEVRIQQPDPDVKNPVKPEPKDRSDSNFQFRPAQQPTWGGTGPSREQLGRSPHIASENDGEPDIDLTQPKRSEGGSFTPRSRTSHRSAPVHWEAGLPSFEAIKASDTSINPNPRQPMAIRDKEREILVPTSAKPESALRTGQKSLATIEPSALRPRALEDPSDAFIGGSFETMRSHSTANQEQSQKKRGDVVTPTEEEGVASDPVNVKIGRVEIQAPPPLPQVQVDRSGLERMEMARRYIDRCEL